MKIKEAELAEVERPKYLDGVKVREKDTFTYLLKGKGWQHGFKTISETLKDISKQDPKLVQDEIIIDFNLRAERGERVR